MQYANYVDEYAWFLFKNNRIIIKELFFIFQKYKNSPSSIYCFKLSHALFSIHNHLTLISINSIGKKNMN